MTKPHISIFGENYFFHFFVATCSSQILYWQNFACQFAKMSYVYTEPCNLHQLLPCIDSKECFTAVLNIPLFWDMRFCHLSDDVILLPNIYTTLCDAAHQKKRGGGDLAAVGFLIDIDENIQKETKKIIRIFNSSLIVKVECLDQFW